MSADLTVLNVIVIPADCPPALAAEFKAKNVGSGFIQLVPVAGASAALFATAPATAATATTPAQPAAVSTDTLTLVMQLLEGGLNEGVTILFPEVVPLLPYIDLIVKNGVPWLVNILTKKPLVERWTIAMLEAELPAAMPTA